MLLTIELYKWVGKSLLSNLDALKPVVLKDLNAAIMDIPNTKPTPKMYLRGKEPVKIEEEEEQETVETEYEEEDEEKASIKVDDSIPFNFIGKLAKNFYTDIVFIG
jgi:hypothetical protein